MNAKETQSVSVEAWETLFKACADRTRIRLLNMMAREGEVCVCDFVDVLQTNQPKVSRHLAYLKRAGLVKDRKDGLWVYYSLALPPKPAFKRLLDCFIVGCTEIPDIQKDVIFLRQVQGRENREIAVKNLGAPVIVDETPSAQSDEIRIELL